MTPSAHRAILAIVLLLAAGLFTLREFATAGRAGLPLDDAWIHAALARNLVQGEGLTPNPGTGSVPCSTAPLWTALEALALGVALPLFPPGDPEGQAAVFAAKGLGLLFALVASLLARRVLLLATGRPGVALFGALLLATHPRFVWGSLSGLEVPLYTAILLLGVELHLRLRDARGVRRFLPLLVFALAGYARPECFLFVPIALADAILAGSRETRRPREVLLRAAVAAAAVATFFATNLLLSDRPLPTTFYVKGHPGTLFARLAHGDDGSWFERLAAGLSFSLPSALEQWVRFAAFLPALSLPLLPAFVAGARRILAEPNRPSSFLPVALLGYPLLEGLLGPTDPEMGFARREFAPAALYLLVAAIGLSPREPSPSKTERRALRPAPLLLAVAFLAVSGWVLAWLSGPGLVAGARRLYLGPEPESAARPLLAPEYPRFRAGIAFFHLALASLAFGLARLDRNRTLRSAFLLAAAAQQVAGLADVSARFGRNVADTHALNVEPAQWVRDHLPSNAKVAVHDLGAFAYFSRRRLLDLEGIGTPWVIAERRRAGGSVLPALVAERPDYLAAFAGWYAQDVQRLVREGHIVLPPLEEWKREDNVTAGGHHAAVVRLRW